MGGLIKKIIKPVATIAGLGFGGIPGALIGNILGGKLKGKKKSAPAGANPLDHQDLAQATAANDANMALAEKRKKSMSGIARTILGSTDKLGG